MIKKKVIASLSAVLLFSSPFLGGIATATGDDSSAVESETTPEEEVVEVEGEVQIQVEEKIVKPEDDGKEDVVVTEEVHEDEVASFVLANVSFNDVTPQSYAYEAIMYLANKGVTNGYGNGIYGLKDDVTRGQVSALIARYLELDTDKQFDNPYTDVKGDFFEKEILAVSNVGFMKGKGNGKFDPKATLTRSEMAQVLMNVFELDVKAEYDFHDMDKSHWALNAVRGLYSNGLTLGSGNNNYNPGGTVTREQYAEFLYRGIHLDEDFVAKPIPPKPEPPKPEKPKPEEPAVHRALTTGNLRDIDTTSIVQAFWDKYKDVPDFGGPNRGLKQLFKTPEKFRTTMSGSLKISNNIKVVKDDKNKRFKITIPEHNAENYSVAVNTEDGQFKKAGTYYAYYNKIEPSNGISFSVWIGENDYAFPTYILYGFLKDGKYQTETGTKASEVLFNH